MKLNFRNINLFSGGYAWVNAQAQAYWLALESANGGNLDTQTIYGVSRLSAMQRVDQTFQDLQTEGLLTKMRKWSPCLGLTANCQVINSVDPGNMDSVLVNSPTLSLQGVNLNGTTQYVNWGCSGLNFPGLNNWFLSVFVKSNLNGVSTGTFLGNRVTNTNDYINLSYSVATDNVTVRYLVDDSNPSSTIAAGTTNLSGYWAITRSASNLAKTYLNGALFDTNVSTLNPGALNSVNMITGGINENNTTYIINLSSIVRHEILAESLTDLQSLALKDILTTFDSFFGR